MVKSLFKLIFILGIMSTLPSCSLTPDAMVLLERSLLSYDKAIRWGDFVRAKSFHKNAPVLSDLERRRLKFYKVTSYNVLRNETRNRHNANLLVEIKYYKNDRPIIKTVTVKQHWKRDSDSDTWYIDTAFPKFK